MLSQEPPLFPVQIGLRDCKQLAKALQRSLSQRPPASLEEAQALVNDLPWPTAMGQDRLSRFSLERPSSPQGFARLGVGVTPPGTGEAFDWPHASALKGTLAFGPDNGRALLAEHLFLQATLGGTPATWVTVADDARFSERTKDVLKTYGQAHRLRVLNFLPRACSDAFNPIKSGPLASRVEHLVRMMESVPPPATESIGVQEWTSLLVSWLIAMVMHMTTKGAQIGRHPDLAWLLELTDPLEVEKILLEEPALPPHARGAFLALDKKVQALFPMQGYRVLSDWIKGVLAPINARFGHVLLESTSDRPSVAAQDLIGGSCSTVVILPRDSKPVAHLMMEVLSHHSYLHAEPPTEATHVQHLILLDSVGYYGTAVSLGRFQHPSTKRWGLATVLLDEDFPSLKPMGEHVAEAVRLCKVKMFLSHDQPTLRAKDGGLWAAQPMHRHLNFLEGSDLRLLDCAFLAPEQEPSAQGTSPRRESILTQMAKVLWEHHQAFPDPTLARCQQAVARMTGRAHWHELEQRTTKSPTKGIRNS